MAEILRSWRCLNTRCDRVFDAWDANPACPGCGCVRVQWVPGGGHVAGTAKAADAELRNLADIFRMKDMNSARRGERAMPKLDQPKSNERQTTFAPGFTGPVSMQGATCMPSTTGVSYKAKVGIGAALSRSRSDPGIGSHTRVEARHSNRA